MPTIVILRILIGNCNQFVGCLKYINGQYDSDIAAGGALLTILAVVAVACVYRRGQSAGWVLDEPSADQQESRERNQNICTVALAHGPQSKGTGRRDDYLTPRSTEGIDGQVQRSETAGCRRESDQPSKHWVPEALAQGTWALKVPFYRKGFSGTDSATDLRTMLSVQSHQGADVSSKIGHPVISPLSQADRIKSWFPPPRNRACTFCPHGFWEARQEEHRLSCPPYTWPGFLLCSHSLFVASTAFRRQSSLLLLLVYFGCTRVHSRDTTVASLILKCTVWRRRKLQT